MERDRVIIQSDWNETLREKGGKAWIAFKKYGRNTVYSELKGQACATAKSGVSVHSADGFIVEQYSRLHITVQYSSDSSGTLRYHFQAPDKTFTNVHPTKKQVACLDVTPGGLAASCDTDGHLLVWTTDNGEPRRRLEGHYGDVYTCRFFPSGVVILSGGADTQLKIWSAETGQCAATLIGHSSGVMDVAIVERGRNIVSVSRDGTARLWDCGKSACLAKYAADSVINGCSLHSPAANLDLLQPDHVPDDREVLTEGKLLLLACENGALQGFGLHSRKKVFETSVGSPVNCCCYVNDSVVACGTQDSTLHCIDLRVPSCPLSSTKEARSAILSVMSLGQNFIFTAGDGSCVCVKTAALTGAAVDAEDEQLCTELTGSDCDPVYRAVSDGRSLFTCCRDSVIRRYTLNSL